MTDTSAAPPKPRVEPGVWLLSVTIVVAGLAVLAFTSFEPASLPGSPIQLHWVVLAAVFAVSEVTHFHVQRGDEAHTFAFTEVPMILGLIFLSPAGLFLARVGGGLSSLAIVRRQSPRKLVFNGALFFLETAVGLTVYRAVLGVGDQPVDPIGWLAASLSMLAIMAVGMVGVTAVISITTSVPTLRETLTLTGFGVITALASTSVGLVAVLLLFTDPWAIGLLVILATTVFMVHRGYVNLVERHRSLEALHSFTSELQGVDATGVDNIGLVLARGAELLRAEDAGLMLFGPDRLMADYLVASGGDVLSFRVSFEQADAAVTALLDQQSAAFTPGSQHHGFLEPLRADHRGVVAAPLSVDGVLAGLIFVAKPKTTVGQFDQESVQLLDTVANHVSVTLDNGDLIAKVKHEADQRLHQASHDALTGLANRTRLLAEIEARVAASRDGDMAEPMHLMMLAVDGAKEITDTLGREIGDTLLSEMSRRLQAVVPEGSFVSRVSDNDFCVLPGPTDRDQIRSLAADVVAVLDDAFSVGEVSLAVSGHVGIATYPNDAREPEQLLQRADVAVSAAKSDGASVEFYTEARDPFDPDRLSLAAELKDVINSGGLEVYFQPKVDMATGKVASAEALVRWDHPRHGFVSPERFIPVAESTNMIAPLTIHVVREAAQQLRRWRDNGYDMTVAVNVSARNLSDLHLADDIGAILADAGLHPRLLILELTESSFMADNDRVNFVIDQLHQLGVQLSVDDFGTGYSSLVHLRRLPLTELKVDKSFVMTMAVNRPDATIVETTIGLAHGLGLRTVAEGIETQATWDLLATAGCELAQGYFISRPLPAELFEQWLVAREPMAPDDEVLQFPRSQDIVGN